MSNSPIDQVLHLMATLRDPEHGCPWDCKQTFASIAPYTIEEAYEVADAIDRDNHQDLCDELGDLLLQVVFHARMAEEQGLFSFTEVCENLSAKLIRRHPHVFADSQARSDNELHAAWEQQKALERSNKTADKNLSVLAGIANNLPALKRAEKLQKRAARVGFDWQDAEPIYAKIEEEIAEVKTAIAHESFAQQQAEIGDVLFAVSNLARHYGIDPEAALRTSNRKFEQRFQHIEHCAKQAGRDLTEHSLDELEAYWQQAKQLQND